MITDNVKQQLLEKIADLEGKTHFLTVNYLRIQEKLRGHEEMLNELAEKTDNLSEEVDNHDWRIDSLEENLNV